MNRTAIVTGALVLGLCIAAAGSSIAAASSAAGSSIAVSDTAAAAASSAAVSAAAAATGSSTASSGATVGAIGPAQADESPQLWDDTVLHELAITFEEDNWLALLNCAGGRWPGSLGPFEDVPAVLEVDGTRLEDVGVRCKGNSSLGINGTKKPLNITTDAFVAGQDLGGFDVINLNNGWSDPTLLRDAIALRLVGLYAPASRFAYARVTIQGQYIGLYTMVEQVNGEFADYWYPNDDGVIIKGDSPTRIAFNTSTLNWEGESLDAYKRGYEVKGRAAGDDAAYEALREFTRALDAPVGEGGLSDDEFREGIRQVLDVESALWYLAASNLIANFDSYYVGKNYFLYNGENDPRFHLVTWDVGLSFGVFNLQGGGRMQPGREESGAAADPFAQEDEQNRPLIRRLLAVPEYRADYLAHYRALYDEVFTTEWVEDAGEQYQDLIREAARDEEAAQGRIAGSYTFEQFESNLYEPLTTGGWMRESKPGILSLVTERRAYLDRLGVLQAPDVQLLEQAYSPEEPTVADEVDVWAEFGGNDTIDSVELRYRIDGGFEHQRQMSRSGNDWQATIPAQRQGADVTYVFRVGLADGSSSFYPTATLTRPYSYHIAGLELPRAQAGVLVINELMADNETTIADEVDEYDDWVELYNRGTDPISLSGFFLSDDVDDPWAYELPDVELAPGGYYLVWCDNDPEQGENHADFRLSADGESIFLSTEEETLDSFDFGKMAADESFMRLPDGADEWYLCGRATPLEANVCNDTIPTRTPSPTPSAPTSEPPETATPTPSAPTSEPPATDTPTVATPTATPTESALPFAIWLPYTEAWVQR